MSRSAPCVVALLCAVTLAACGGSSSSSGPSASSSSSTPGAAARPGGRDPAAFAKFRSCLQSHGVKLPGRPPGAGGAAPGTGTGAQPPAGGRRTLTAAQRKAMRACAKLRPRGAGPGAGGFRTTRNAAAFTAYLTCLKSRGLAIDVHAGFGALRNLKRDDPKLQPALKACASKLPQRPQTPAPTGAS